MIQHRLYVIFWDASELFLALMLSSKPSSGLNDGLQALQKTRGFSLLAWSESDEKFMQLWIFPNY